MATPPSIVLHMSARVLRWSTLYLCIIQRMCLHVSPDDAEEDHGRSAGPTHRSGFIAARMGLSVEDARHCDEIEASLGSTPTEGHDWDEYPGAWVRAQRRLDPVCSG